MITINSNDFIRVRKWYEELKPKVEEGLADLLEEEFKKAAQRTRRRAPKRTGALRGAIDYAIHRNRWNVRGVVYVDVDALYGERERATLSSGKEDYYPAYVEYGTHAAGRRKRKGEEKGIRTPGNKAKPFMRPGRAYIRRTVPRKIKAMLKALEEE